MATFIFLGVGFEPRTNGSATDALNHYAGELCMDEKNKVIYM